jgi:hypothetical protein
MDIVVKNFKPHFNRAMWKQINTEKQYKEEMKRGNYVPYEQGVEQARKNREEQGKMGFDKMSDKAKELSKAAFDLTKQGRGNERPSDRMIEAYKEIHRRK